MSRNFNIAGREIGRSHPPYIICELSANHNGSLERALEFDGRGCLRPGRMPSRSRPIPPDTITIDHDSDEFRVESGLWAAMMLYDLYREAYTPYEWHQRSSTGPGESVLRYFRARLAYETAVDFWLASTHRLTRSPPSNCRSAADCLYGEARQAMIMSTGIANLRRIRTRVDDSAGGGSPRVVLFIASPTTRRRSPKQMSRTVPHLGAAFQGVSGLSDHSPGIRQPVRHHRARWGHHRETFHAIARRKSVPDAAFSA